MFSVQQVCGLRRDHVIQFSEPRYAATAATAQAFLRLREAARADGIDLVPYASYRDFNAQLRIWNRKFSGQKTLYDIDEHGRDFGALDPQQLVWAILGWHSLPGASRRHWGSDIDVIDRNVMPPGYKPSLLPSEVAPGGVFHALHGWLDDHIDAFGFYRPYAWSARDYREAPAQAVPQAGAPPAHGAMFPEPWHLSYAPAALAAADALDADFLAATIAGADMLGKDIVLEMLPDILARHVHGVAAPGPMAAALALEGSAQAPLD